MRMVADNDDDVDKFRHILLQKKGSINFIFSVVHITFLAY